MKLIDVGEVAEAFHRRKQTFDLLRSDSLMLAADMEGVALKPSANQRVNAENLLSKAQLLEEAWNDNVIVECNENPWGGTVTLRPNLSQRAAP